MASNLTNNTSFSENELALQSYCKQVLKSQLFKGFYDERRYVDTIKEYRDIIVLSSLETEVKTLLLEVLQRITQFYNNPNLWVGITSKQLEKNSLSNISIWTELEELAFGHYWFSITSVRFRDNEVVIKLKPVRLVESIDNKKDINPERQQTTDNVNFEDFYKLILCWGNSIKQTIYVFMSEGLTKENMKATLKFFSLLFLTLMAATLHGIKFLGIFTIYFLIEFRRLIAVSTPIILRLIDVFNKIIGGFYILIAMVWRDSIGLLTGTRNNIQSPRNAITDRPYKYKRLEYSSHLRR